jgi:hypothetical protein
VSLKSGYLYRSTTIPMNASLPPELTQGAILRDKEYAWELSDFPQALQRAPALGYACLGGQFWFLVSDVSLYEPFWLEASSSDKLADETWSVYARRSCEEVLLRFNALLRDTDFREAAGKFGTGEVDRAPELHWMFNAYFVTEPEFLSLNFGG